MLSALDLSPVTYRFRSAVSTEFLEDTPRQLVFEAAADSELLADFLVQQSVIEASENLLLPQRQRRCLVGGIACNRRASERPACLRYKRPSVGNWWFARGLSTTSSHLATMVMVTTPTLRYPARGIN